MSGLLGTAMSARNEAGQLWDQAAGREQSLNSARDAFKAAERQQRTSMVGTGAGIGAAVGLSGVLAGGSAAAAGASSGMVLGPVGALVGAGIGLLVNELF
jgi:hypothetical protein